MAAVIVTSSADTVVAVGRVATLTAVAMDGSGGVVGGASFSWTSLTPSVATVDNAGVVTVLQAGTVTIRASQNLNGVTGRITLRGVDADLAGVAALLQERFARALRGELGASATAAVDGLVGSCTTSIDAGNVRAVDACLSDLLAVNGAGGDDDALLAVLRLFFAAGRAKLRL